MKAKTKEVQVKQEPRDNDDDTDEDDIKCIEAKTKLQEIEVGQSKTMMLKMDGGKVLKMQVGDESTKIKKKRKRIRDDSDEDEQNKKTPKKGNVSAMEDDSDAEIDKMMGVVEEEEDEASQGPQCRKTIITRILAVTPLVFSFVLLLLPRPLLLPAGLAYYNA